ncbi:hypothetical protein H4R19_004761 [Coemansia spiralis]|nr:hypothetical protein H4R19_004761 [Coemansia spiralis]
MAHNNRHDASQTGESSSRPSRSGHPAQAPVYAAIRPRGDPDEHRQAMAEEMEQEHNQALSVRRRKNASSAARMRERQREKEQTLIRRQRELAARERQLTAELATLRAQREQYEGN